MTLTSEENAQAQAPTEQRVMTQLNLKPPEPFSFEGNIAEGWKKWIKKFTTFLVATESDKKSDEVKIAILLHAVGEDGQEKFETFELTEAKQKVYKEVVKAFEDYCIPKKNETVCRHKYFQRTQKEDETFDEFLSDLKKLSLDCAFGELKDSLLRDKIVSGINNTQLKDRLLREEDLKLERCIQLCRTAELASQRMETLQNKQSVNAIKQKPTHTQFQGSTRRGRQGTTEGATGTSGTATTTRSAPPAETTRRTDWVGQRNGDFNQQQRQKCNKCGSQHVYGQCPAFGKACNVCHRKNHFARMCRNSRNVNLVNKEEEEPQTYMLGKIAKINSVINKWEEKVKFLESGKILALRIDTGAECNVLEKNDLYKLNIKGKLQPTKDKLTNYDGSEIPILGTVQLQCQVNSKNENIKYHVVNCTKTSSVLGLIACEKFGLVNRIANVKLTNPEISQLLDKYNDVFKGVGKIAQTYDFKLKEGYVGKVEPCRKVPFRILETYKQELNSMIDNEIITEVNEPTEFVNLVTLARKPNKKIRVCLDPEHLNSCLLREYYRIPTFDEITSKMVGAKVFAVLDASKAFWQIPLTERSSKMTTFQTPFGLYRFLRLPYGVKVAPEVFQKIYVDIFKGITKIAIYIDDLIIWADTENELKEILQQVFERARNSGIKFNKDKCEFAVSKVKFLGHYITSRGIEPDDEKIRAIKEMVRPTDAKAVERLLGMITYVGKFVENLTDLTEPLRDLIKKNSAFIWSQIHENSFQKIKEILCKRPVLQLYDTNKDCKLSVDASSTGVGAVLLQNELPVAYASKAFTPSQKSWAQIEKELYAIVFGCERFHQYVIGKPFEVETDHKPLVPILKRNIADVPLRLQKMRMRLQPFDINVVYKCGKDLKIADTLSRAHLSEAEDDVDPSMFLLEISLTSYISDKKRQEFIKETSIDKELQIVKKLIRKGWPAEIKDVPDIAKAYHTYNTDLYEHDDMLFKNNCVIVPKSMRDDILDKLHYNHLGLEKTKARARDIVFWPGMNRNIEDKISECNACLKFQRSNQKETLIPTPVPDGVWETVATDIFYFKGMAHLIIVDYYSKYVDVICLKDETASQTIKALKTSFVHWGIPKTVRSDNGPQFSSREFKEFAKTWNFEHVTSSPTYPRSNGMAERHIQTVKNVIKKSIL